MLMRAAMQDQAKMSNTPVFLYTVKILHEDGGFHVEEDVALCRVEYRHERAAETAATQANTCKFANEMEIEANTSSKTARQDVTVTGMSNIDMQIDHGGYTVASRSTLTLSDLTMERTHSDIHSQTSYKRKSDPSIRGQCKRVKSGGSVETLSEVTQQLYPSFEPSLHESGNCAKFPLTVDQIPILVGKNGDIINEIERKSSCKISIRGRGNKIRGVDDYHDEPLHARVVGDSNGVKEAIEFIKGTLGGKDLSDLTHPERSYGPVQLEGNQPCCKIHFPPWLVYDDSSKARLHRE